MSKLELFNDHFQNYKVYGIPKAQLVLTDIPYNVGKNAYGSNPSWYIDGDNSNGESALAGKSFFKTDEAFKIPEFMHFCARMLKPEPKERGEAGCIIIFCSYTQQPDLVNEARDYGYQNYIPLTFRKNYSAQVLKANMRIVGNCEYAILLYRDKLPKFRNHGQMIFNCMDWPRDNQTPKVHPNQKPLSLIEKLIEIFTDEGDVVIDPCAGSAVTLLAAANLGRKAFGFESEKPFYREAKAKILTRVHEYIFKQDEARAEQQETCHDMNFDFTGCELDADYWQAQEERFKNHVAQGELFENQAIQASVYEQLEIEE